jgi:hypothetical protein
VGVRVGDGGGERGIWDFSHLAAHDPG